MESKKYTQREIKRILHRISKLSEIEHRGIYKILLQNNLSYTHNNNGLFISMSTIPENVLEEIDTFVNFCLMNNMELDAHEKKINECKYNQFYKVTWNNDDGKPTVVNEEEKFDQSSHINDNKNNLNFRMVMNRSKDISDIEFNNLGETNLLDSDNNDNLSDQNQKNRSSTANWTNILQESHKDKKNILIDQFVQHLDGNLEQMIKKKVNMRYTNAKKKFGRKLNVDKKCDHDILNELEEEQYVF